MFRMSLTPLFNQRANYRAKVVSINEVAPAHYQIQLNVPALAKAAMPGQFVHICPVPNSEADSFDPLLRRAFSIMRVRNPERDAIDVLFRVEGRGTQALARACNGDEIDLIGPLGQPFDMSPFKIPDANSPTEKTSKVFHVKHFPTSAIVVGGGSWRSSPCLSERNVQNKRNRCLCHHQGARTSSDVVGWHELSAICRDVSVTTDDGSWGHHGRVTDKLVALLDSRNNENKRGISPVVYTLVARYRCYAPWRNCVRSIRCVARCHWKKICRAVLGSATDVLFARANLSPKVKLQMHRGELRIKLWVTNGHLIDPIAGFVLRGRRVGPMKSIGSIRDNP